MNTNLQTTHRLIAEFNKENWLYGVLARGAARLLRHELAKAGIDVFDISWRTKSLPSVVEKIEKKSYRSLADISDRAGVRVICLYAQDVEKVANHILRLFCVEKIEDALKREGLTSFGYASKHFLLKWNGDFAGPTHFDDLPAYMRSLSPGEPIKGEIREKLEGLVTKANEAARPRTFELQLRTILQHAWASVSHEFIYKHESEVSERTHRRLARLAALLEEVDEAFSSEAGERDHSSLNSPLFPDLSQALVSERYLKQYSKDVLGLQLSDEKASWSMDYLAKMNVKSVADFEELMCSSIEALESATRSVLLNPIRGLWTYLNVLAYWADCAESVLVPTQQNIMDQYRHLVHEEHFQRVLRRQQSEP